MPRLRGVLHQYAFFVAVAAGALLVALGSGARERVAAGIFAGALATCFGVSALYHRLRWSPQARRWMRRLDHAAIYLLIAGTYTPFGLLAMDGAWRASVLAVVWSGAALAIVLKLFWIDAPRWVTAAVAVALGWVGVVAVPELIDAGVAVLALAALGGVLYTAGAVVYARRKPDPVPAVFGFHELFHALSLAAAAAQYAAVALLLVS